MVYNGDILYTTVNNANLFSNDVSYSKNTPSTINWYNGVFNNGLFGNSSITFWESGQMASTGIENINDWISIFTIKEK